MTFRGFCVAALAAVLFLCLPQAASALPDCTVNRPEVRVLKSGQGTLESAIVDRRGRLYYTSAGGGGRLLRLERPRGEPQTMMAEAGEMGGLAIHGSGDLLVGFGNSLIGGATGNVDPQAGLTRLNPRTLGQSTYAEGLAMANGVARMRDGTVFASDDVGFDIDRISPSGEVQNGWASVYSGNGMAVGVHQRWLYIAQTFGPATVQRVLIRDPSVVRTYFRAPLEDLPAGLDGMARDAKGNLFVTANLYGELWRIGRDGSACNIAGGLGSASAVAVGKGKRHFKRGNLYVVNFGGEVIELRGGMRTRP